LQITTISISNTEAFMFIWCGSLAGVLELETKKSEHDCKCRIRLMGF